MQILPRSLRVHKTLLMRKLFRADIKSMKNEHAGEDLRVRAHRELNGRNALSRRRAREPPVTYCTKRRIIKMKNRIRGRCSRTDWK